MALLSAERLLGRGGTGEDRDKAGHQYCPC